MKLPTKFDEILKSNQSLYGSVNSTLSTFETWLKQNYLPFFPEYTDHSKDHVEQVMTATQALIRDEAWDIVSPEDIAVLSLAVLVHDSGMHLSEDGFIRLVSADDPWPHSHNPGAPTWSQLWTDFLGEASRFDARKLKSLFDDDKPARKPPLDAQEMTRRDRMLIGEFLRRHHPRLAYEIALNGVPGPGSAHLIFQNVPKHIAHLSGLVAHSHGVPLRDAAEALVPEQRRETQGAHVPFLMALLRIADYLQIQQERAPEDVLRIRSLRSPISSGEWQAHAAVKDVNNTHDDVEAIYVRAEPEDVKTFLKLKNLFSSIQHELDASWAVLGEIYAIHPKLNRLGLSGLTIRRIRSNLDKVQEFGKTVSYIPEKVSLKTANAELVNLLIEPLYGANPEIGVRELLQNAVDACRELDDYLEQNPNVNPDFPRQKVHVKVELYTDEKGKRWFRIRDKGIGMTLQTVKDFFLTAGASFRASDIWKKQHVADDGHSRVLRSGRFGIGALAAFLIGNEVHVTTRHVSESANEAICFALRVSDDVIELRHTTSKIGTTIEIPIEDAENWKKLTDMNYNRLHLDHAREIWRWYYLKYPNASFSIEGKELPHPTYFPAESEVLDFRWRALSHPDYKAIYWATKGRGYSYRDDSVLTCNGIFITERFSHDFFKDKSSLFNLDTPQISVFDNNGKLPVNLQRTELHSLPFKDDLIREIIKDKIAYMLIEGPESILAPLPTEYSMLNTQREGFPISWLLYGKDGFVFADKWLITHLGFNSIVSTLQSNVHLRKKVHALSAPETLFAHLPIYESTYKKWLEQSLQTLNHESATKEELKFFVGSRTLISSERYKDFQTPGKYRKELREEFTGVGAKNGWVLLESGSLKSESFNFSAVTRKSPHGDAIAIAEFYFDKEEWVEREPSLAGDVWQEVVGDVAIPYTLDERKRLLPHSFETLDEYIQKHLALAEEKEA